MIGYVNLSNLPIGTWYHAVYLRIQVKDLPDVQLPQLEFGSNGGEVQRDEILERWVEEVLK